jgi:magnesium transporter
MISYYKNGIKGLVDCEIFEPDCWINVETPAAADKSYLINELQIPENFYDDIEDIDERPRIEFEDGWYLVILRIPVKTDQANLPFSTVPLGIIFKGNIFASICFHATDLIPDFIRHMRRKAIDKKSNFDIVLRLLLSSSVWYHKYLKMINKEIKLAETKLEKSIRNEDLQALMQIEKCLVYFTTSLKGNDILVQRVRNIREFKNTHDQELVEDVEIELRQAQDTTKIYSDILSGMMDAYASVISNNLNIIMKLLTSISIILMIPTLIASFYGMNVPNVFQENHYGFWIVMLISFSISALCVFVFRKMKLF